ncbi:hypothetical protein OAV06_02285 [Acidimicrobiia bacterium]|nr:hypothetical protein [Acidimicrobiia bacterium]
MTNFFESLIEPNELSKEADKNNSVKRLSSAHLDKENDATMEKLINTLLHLDGGGENYTLSETLRKDMENVFIKFLNENLGSMDMTHIAQHLLLRKDKKDSEAEVKTLLKVNENDNPLREGDIVKLSSSEVEDLLVVIQQINTLEMIITCAPFLTDTFIATQSALILNPNQSTLEVEAAILLDYSFELEPSHISSYVGRCYKPKGNEQGLSSSIRGISLKATQDVRDIERARLARVINFYAANEGAMNLENYKLDPIIADSRKKESISIEG